MFSRELGQQGWDYTRSDKAVDCAEPGYTAEGDMRIVVTGATGSIGLRLTEVLAEKHDVIGVVRSMPPVSSEESRVRYVSYAHRASLVDSLEHADVVVHAAINWRPKGQRLDTANLELTKDILDLSLSGSCKLFVFFSSMVVYSGTLPDGESGYREDQECPVTKHLDAYSRLKIHSERMVIEACERAKVPYLILRPTAVLGPGLTWTRGSIWAARRLGLGIKGRTMNLIDVEDLCRYVDRLIDLRPANEIVNIGGVNYPTEKFFGRAGEYVGREMHFLSGFALALFARMLPSSLWLLKTDINVDCRKLQQITGIQPSYRLEDMFRSDPLMDARGDSLATLKSIQASRVPYKAYGLGYSLALTPVRDLRREKRVEMAPYRGIVALHGDLVTVKAGTLLSEITRFLDQVDLTLATLPEFSGITAGACFFVDVHGSSNEYFALRDLIQEVKYLDSSGNTLSVSRDDPEWDRLREKDSGVFLTELTFRCEQSGFLTNRLEFRDEDVLEDYILTKHRENLSTTVQWYPSHHKCLIYNINRTDVAPEVYAPAGVLYRHLPYPWLRLFFRWRMRGAGTQYGRYAEILGNWSDLPLRKVWHRLPPRRRQGVVFSVEMCLPIEDGARLASTLKQQFNNGNAWLPKRGSIGFRFSYRKSQQAEKPEGFVWVEFVWNEAAVLDRLVAVARRASEHEITFHQGKYVPSTASL